MNDIEDEVLAIVHRYRDLGAVVADLTAQQATLRERFAALVPLGFEVEVDGKAAYRRGPNRAFDLSAAVEAAERLGVPVKRDLTVDVGDLKARLTAAGALDAAMLPGKGAERVAL